MKVKTLNQCHPSRDGARLERLRALSEGGTAWRALLTHWFPQRYKEPNDVYTERKQLAGYTNHAGSLVGMLAAMLFGEAPVAEGLPDGDAYYTGFLANCDRQGSDFGTFWRHRLIDALVGRRAYAWVNLPARPEDVMVESLADEQKLGLTDAFLVPIEPEQVLDWGNDDHGNLIWLIFRDELSERAGVDAERKRKYRWTYIDGEQIRRWVWEESDTKSEPDDEDDAKELPSIVHGIGMLPVVELALPDDLWMMGKLEDPAIRELRARNEHSWALHQAANELLTITQKWEDENPSLGHGHFLKLHRDGDGEDKAAYVAPAGTAFEYLERDIAACREDLYRVVQQMALSADSDASRMRMSGESKAQDWKAGEVILGTYAAKVRKAMRSALLLVAKARGTQIDEDTVSVSGLDGWEEEDLMTFLEAAALVHEAREMSPTFRKVVAKRQVRRLLQSSVSQDELKKIEGEIDQAPDDAGLYNPPPPPGQGGQPADDEGDDQE